MPTYSVRSIVQWSEHYDPKKKYIYEERITAWNVGSLNLAIEQAEEEAKDYAVREGFTVLDLFQAHWMTDEVDSIPDGTELYSLLRDSDLDPSDYLDAFFDTGNERSSDYHDEKEV